LSAGKARVTGRGERERCGDLEEIEDSIFHSELNVLTTIRKGTEERGADLNFLFESLKFSHVANELLIDLWHLGHQILETQRQCSQLDCPRRKKEQ
jgi:hypothetical protein